MDLDAAPIRIGIVGCGTVGQSLQRTFSADPRRIVVHRYDKLVEECCSEEHKRAVNRCDIVFVAVPTPSLPSGPCDTSIVEEVVEWLVPPICIKSTIPPGTTARLVASTSKRIVFSPEYVGESPFHKYRDAVEPELVVMGGEPDTCELFFSAYRMVFGPNPTYHQTDAVTAELAKYMENCFFAAKVAFVGQFYQLAATLGANFTQLREIWVSDSRVGRSHSTVVGRPGFTGRCLPKDLSAMIACGEAVQADVSLLAAIESFNRQLAGRPATGEAASSR